MSERSRAGPDDILHARALGIVRNVLRDHIGAPSCPHAILLAPTGHAKTAMLARVAARLRTGPQLRRHLDHEGASPKDFRLAARSHLAPVLVTCDPDRSRVLRATPAALAWTTTSGSRCARCCRRGPRPPSSQPSPTGSTPGTTCGTPSCGSSARSCRRRCRCAEVL